MTDWQALADEYKREFKNFAPLGKYKVKVEKATVAATTTGSIRVTFEFQDSADYKYPKSAAHWVSRKNIGWTKWHHACLLQVLGVPEAKAQQAIDSVEKDNATQDQLMKGYQTLYDRAASRHPEVDIEVREQYDRDGNKVLSDKGYAYTESEFIDSRVHSSNQPKTTTPTETAEAVESLGGEEIDLGDDIPF